METNQTAARTAKRFLDDRTRNDWAYPDQPPPWEHSDEEVRNATEFRERYYGESESSDSDIEPSTGASKDADHDAYKFDSPDAIGDAVGYTREQRRKRRRLRLEEEMAENEGLRIWVERRDAWTGAASARKYNISSPAKLPAIAQHDSGNGVADTMQLDPPPPPSITQTTDSGEAAKAQVATFDLVPVAPRLLPDNPIRASINPKAYSDIYNKIVTSSRTPSVPINLSDMTRALVQGWKDTNEWPPKIGVVDPLAGRKRGRLSSGQGVVGGVGQGFIQRHPHLEKGVGSVKKILHLNGHHGEGGREGS